MAEKRFRKIPRVLLIRSDCKWWRDLSCWIQLRVLRQPAAIDPRKTVEPWENEHAALLAAELDEGE